MVARLRDGDVPKAAPNQHRTRYTPARLTGRWTIDLDVPIGTVSKEMSHTFGQAKPPLNAPTTNDVNAAKTIRGKSPTAVWLHDFIAGWMSLARMRTRP